MYIRIIVCFVIYITYTYVRRARALGLKNFNAKFKKKIYIFIQAYILYLDFICFIVLKINSINTLLLNVLNCKMNGIKLFIMFE